MSEWLVIAAWTLLAGLAIPLGATLARFENIRPDWLETEFRHSVIAFGGGALLSAVALVLVPEGARELSVPATALCFFAGAVAFMTLDVWLAKSNRPTTQLVAMLSDFLPEALALGAMFTAKREIAPLLAGIIALQNFPEGFNAYRELAATKSIRATRLIATFLALAMLGPIAGLGGYFVLAESPAIVAAIMLFAGGGILYLVFQDIAPQAKLARHWAPPLGAVAGFLLGVIGDMLSRGG